VVPEAAECVALALGRRAGAAGSTEWVGGVGVQERGPLPIGDDSRGQFGDLGGEVVGDGVDDVQGLAGFGEAELAVAGVPDLDPLTFLGQAADMVLSQTTLVTTRRKVVAKEPS
jgi:hypothetical protein